MRTLILFASVLFFTNCTNTQTNKGKTYNLLVGTYTNDQNTNGIHVYSFNSENGKSSFRSKIGNIRNPSYLTISEDGKNVYSVSEVGKGSIHAFSFEAQSGELKFLNSVSSGGAGPCYVSVNKDKTFVFAGNYGSGSLAAIRVENDGSLNPEIQAIQHKAITSKDTPPAKPHVHSVVLSPDEKHLLVSDLGIDHVNIYNFNQNTNPALQEATSSFTSVEKGGGPRHLTFHPNGKFAYLILEMGAAIVVFDYKDGKLETRQTITMLRPDFKGGVEAADIHISPDGKFLYGSNRADANDIVIYSIAKNGILTYVGRQTSLVHNPRSFAIDPSGNYLLVANQDSNEIIVFTRNKKTGLLTATGEKITVDKPVCLKFTEMNLNPQF